MILDATLTSLKVVILAVIITFLISLVAVYFLVGNKNKIKKFLEILIILPMFIPPSAIGYLILIVCGKNGFIGRLFEENFNISIIFTLGAAVIASVIVTIPIMYQSIKSAVLSVDKNLKNAAEICGASSYEIFTKIILPLSKRGIFTGVLLAFARAFGEFGATILVAGNIRGKTQTIPMALYYAIEGDNSEVAMKLLMVVFILAIFLVNIYNVLTTRSE